MKKIIPILVIIGLVFALWACNSPGGSDGAGSGEPAEDAFWEDDVLFGNSEYPFSGTDGSYPGFLIDLTALNLSDITKYNSVTVNATLYTDEAGTTKATTPTGDNTNLAQFALLKGGQDAWTNTCGPTKYGMAIDGDTTWVVPPEGASGVPTNLLVQANWADFSDGTKVKSIKVHKITFTAKTSAAWLLDSVYGGSKVTVAGNTITFDNATGSDHAATLIFDPAWKNLDGKKLVIDFTIPAHTENPSKSGVNDPEHQFRIQAANSDNSAGYTYYNGDGDYQLYPTLDSTGETGWSADTHSGILKIALDKLIEGAEKTPSTGNGPFKLDAIRIVNDGTTWTDSSTGVEHVRCKSYSVVFNSVAIE